MKTVYIYNHLVLWAISVGEFFKELIKSMILFFYKFCNFARLSEFTNEQKVF